MLWSLLKQELKSSKQKNPAKDVRDNFFIIKIYRFKIINELHVFIPVIYRKFLRLGLKKNQMKLITKIMMEIIKGTPFV